MNRFLAIAVGAALGANARYLVGQWSVKRFGPGFPTGTMLVNVTGSLILGFLVTWLSSRMDVLPEVRLLLVVGFLGSYTTFSSYAVESLTLLQRGDNWLGLINVLGNNGVAILAALLGVYLAQWVTP